jgi:hypothetical protein
MREQSEEAYTFLSEFWQRLSQHKVLFSLLMLAILARVYLLLHYEVNWDEFYYLSFVHQFLAGEFISSFQTFHVHFFGWLSKVSNNEIDQILAARLVMLVCQIATSLIIFNICRRHLSFSSALFAVLAYVTFSFVVRTGTSFRTDPIATLCLMMTLDYLMRLDTKYWHLLLSAFSLSLAFMFTLKSALYLPTFVSIIVLSLLRSINLRLDAFRLALHFLVALIVYLTLYIWHSGLVTSTIDQDAIAMLSGADKTLNHREVFPRLSYFTYTLRSDFSFWIVFSFGFAYCLLSSFSFFDNNTSRKINFRYLMLIPLMFPLLLLFIYRNAFPYFYTFMLAPVSVFCGVAWERWTNYSNIKSSYVIATRLVLVFFVANLIAHGIVQGYTRNMKYQRQLLDVVHRVFPEPVPYIDRCSMVSSYPKKGIFMSSWGMENYLTLGEPIFKQIIEEQEPVFLLINSSHFKSHDSALLIEDVLALENNYIPHWNELYVAGKTWNFTLDNHVIEFDLMVSGDYTLEGGSHVFINDMRVSPNETITMSKGKHVIRTNGTFGQFTLRWGKGLYRPHELKRDIPVFSGF